MKHLLITSFFILLVFGCKTKEESKEVDPPIITEETIPDVHVPQSLDLGCYTYEANGNKIELEISQSNDSIVGQLNYAFKEKDANSGSFSGMLRDSILMGSYTFASEGIESSREVAFLWKDGQLYEGFGELDETGTKFKDKETIIYSSSMPLTKTDCD
ncbi:hypothetical protein [Flagellimonas zhangzhouensis]|uniref:Uncharacterized protein n=1 Tax=Flagellimonas zhangzhouensis TaxID=1073328 RepID=A0A1H2V4Y3_9FLAO|nr:hypothetical protein [Allomuricauda zhangzhouensis]SDQ10752.1 hypothetical protein SAMN05216294_0371 [Allomuricauda zhangzhouensis]SDW63426.1 hypothetical protein SAMN04487892_1920 [Allomuricauda zhangzhouensis]